MDDNRFSSFESDNSYNHNFPALEFNLNDDPTFLGGGFDNNENPLAGYNTLGLNETPQNNFFESTNFEVSEAQQQQIKSIEDNINLSANKTLVAMEFNRQKHSIFNAEYGQTRSGRAFTPARLTFATPAKGEIV